MVREHIDTRWEDPDKLMPPSDKTREGVLSRVVKDIAGQRLAFPNAEFPSLRTHVNVPGPALVLRAADGAELTPDIVVAEARSNRPVARSSVTDTTFYLYVPAGFAAEAKRLLKKHRIKSEGLRTWRYVTGLETLDITDIGYGSLLELLLPPFLLRRRGH